MLLRVLIVVLTLPGARGHSTIRRQKKDKSRASAWISVDSSAIAQNAANLTGYFNPVNNPEKCGVMKQDGTWFLTAQLGTLAASTSQRANEGIMCFYKDAKGKIAFYQRANGKIRNLDSCGTFPRFADKALPKSLTSFFVDDDGGNTLKIHGGCNYDMVWGFLRKDDWARQGYKACAEPACLINDAKAARWRITETKCPTKHCHQPCSEYKCSNESLVADASKADFECKPFDCDDKQCCVKTTTTTTTTTVARSCSPRMRQIFCSFLAAGLLLFF